MNKIDYIFIVVVICLASFLEVVAIVSVAPVLSSITGSENFGFFSFLKDFSVKYAGQLSDVEFFIVVFLVLNFTSICSQILRMASLRNFQIKYASYLDQRFFSRLAKLETFKSKNIKKNDLLSIIAVKIDEVILRTVTPILNSFANITIIGFSLVSLLYIDLVSTLMLAGLTGAFYVSISLLINSKIRACAVIQDKNRSELLTTSEELIQSWKQVDNYCAGSFFIQPAIGFSINLRKAQNTISFYAAIPRYLLELCLLLALILAAVLFDVSKDQNSLSFLGIFLFAAVRLIPQIQQLFGNLTVLRGNKEIFQTVKEFLQVDREEPSIKDAGGDRSTVIELKIPNWRNHNDLLLQIKPDRIRFNPGKVISILGNSGIGKSTLFDFLLGYDALAANDFGQSRDIGNLGLSKRVAYVPQDAQIFHLSLKQNITLSNDDIINEEAFDRALRVSGLGELIELGALNLDLVLVNNGSQLSGGQRQRVLIARAIYLRREVLIFDETFSALDVKSSKSIIQLIRADKKECVVIITHDKEIADISDERLEINVKQN